MTYSQLGCQRARTSIGNVTVKSYVVKLSLDFYHFLFPEVHFAWFLECRVVRFHGSGKMLFEENSPFWIQFGQILAKSWLVERLDGLSFS